MNKAFQLKYPHTNRLEHPDEFTIEFNGKPMMKIPVDPNDIGASEDFAKRTVAMLNVFGNIEDPDQWMSDQIKTGIDAIASMVNMRSQRDAMLSVLKKVANWELPATGKFWDREKTDPMSYTAEFGTNGVRDYFKQMALLALIEVRDSQKK